MLEDLLSNRRFIARHREGPLGHYVDAFIERQRSQGYSRFNMRYALHTIRRFGCWLSRRKLAACHVSKEVIDTFWRKCGNSSGIRSGGRAVLNSLLDQLKRTGVVALEDLLVEESKSTQIEQEYRRYLQHDRALSIATIKHYCPVVRLFISERFGSGLPELSEITVLDIHNFVSRHAHDHDYGPKHIQLILTALRSFLRFLYLRGHIVVKLADHVPAVASWKLQDIPRWLNADDVEHVLECCDPQLAGGGTRNHAILLLLARLGLRAGEIVSLTLEDIRWESGEITVRGKGQHRKRFPLPEDAGRALALYLKKARPECNSRRVFIKSRAPFRELGHSSTVSTIVRRALARANLDPPCKGAHLFRHSLATNMLRKGASLSEIGQILHHKSPDTTAIYAKVDFNAMQALAQPWPGDRT